MDPIATSTTYQSILTQIQAAESRELSAQQQVSTGNIGDNLSGFGSSTDAIVAAQSVQTRVNGLVSQLNQTSTALTFQQTALTQVSSIAQQLQKAVTEAEGEGSGDDLMNQVQSLFDQAASALNTQYNGQYTFSGGSTSTQPFTASQLSDLVPTGASDTTLLNLSQSPDTSSDFQNGSLAQVSRIDDNTTIQTGFLASDVGQGLMNAFQSMEAFQQSSQGNFGGDLTSAQETFLQGMITQLNSLVTSTSQTTAEGGDVQNQVATALTTQQARQTTLQTVIGNMTQADAAQAATNLTQAQTAFQAAAEVFNTLKGMSLLNYLSTPTG